MEIKNWKTGKVIYKAEVDTIKELVEKAVKEGVSLKYANLRDADLEGTQLSNSDLRDANLYYADLCGAYLCDADLRGADLSGAYLYGADLTYADLRDAKNVPDNIPMVCPKEGSFVGWKKVE